MRPEAIWGMFIISNIWLAAAASGGNNGTLAVGVVFLATTLVMAWIDTACPAEGDADNG